MSKLAVLVIFLLVSGSVASAQLVEQFNPPRSEPLQDWGQLGRYDGDNQRLKSLPAQPGRVVFLGDSITESWKLSLSFPGKPYVNRGISGQTTPQMLVRMFPDVIELKPAAMILLAGTNDIAGNTGPVTLAQIQHNFQAMVELAQAHGIKVILCTVVPVSDYTPTKQTVRRPPADILRLNAWIKEYAAKTRAVVADYYSALVDEKGMLRQGFADDGLHPNARGYARIAPVAAAAIEKALR